MTDASRWLEANSHYLSSALVWLRLLLKQRTGETDSEREEPSRAYSGKADRRSDLKALQSAQREMERIESEMTSPPALNLLSERLGLSKFERNVLLLCAAAEFDPSICTLFTRSSDHGCAYATFALGLSIFEEPAWDALSPHRPLRYWRLIEINQPGSQSLTTSPLRADERIVNFIKGLNYLDDRLTPYLSPVELLPGGGELPKSQQEMAAQITSYWRQAQATPSMPLIQLVGIDGASKQVVAAQAAAAIGRRLYRLPVEALPQQSGDLELLVRLWQRESALLPVALYVDAQEAETSASSPSSAWLRRFLARTDGILMVAVREAWASVAQESWTVDIAKPTVEEQREEWSKVISDGDGEDAALLAGQFNLNLTDIRQIAMGLTSENGRDGQSMAERVWDACRVRVRPLLDSLAHRLELKATWEDIVLPAQELNLLQQIAGQVTQRTRVYADWGFVEKMNRGLGITALFAGESGTGKTLAAEVLANELRLNLYRIDLSAVVSKYIGETEKNLRRLFDAAEDGGAILFFDEADALFGKRSEVKDSHDRYANIEVNYLLQRMEAYRGLAILATNMRSALDIAFTRRLRFIVTFPFPTAADRTRMWQKAFPQKTPVDDLDYGRLARVNLTGGSIHNAAINAAFLAAQTNRSVNMGSVLTAIRNELIKMDRPINEAEFRWHEPTGVVA